MTGKNKNRDQAPDQEQKNPVRYALPVKRPLGTILVDGKFIKPETLDAALDQQKQTRDLLGNILVNMGMLDPADLNAALMVQRDFSTIEDAINAAAGVRMMLENCFWPHRALPAIRSRKRLKSKKEQAKK